MLKMTPAYLVAELSKLADNLSASDKALEDFFKYKLPKMPPGRAKQFEALFPERPPYFEIKPYAKKIEEMADEWQTEIDAEIR